MDYYQGPAVSRRNSISMYILIDNQIFQSQKLIISMWYLKCFEVKKPGFQWRSSLKAVQWLDSSGDQGQVSRYEGLFGSGLGPSGVQCWSVRLLCTEPDGLEVSREDDEELPWKWKPGHGASKNIGNIMELNGGMFHIAIFDDRRVRVIFFIFVIFPENPHKSRWIHGE